MPSVLFKLKTYFLKTDLLNRSQSVCCTDSFVFSTSERFRRWVDWWWSNTVNVSVMMLKYPISWHLTGMSWVQRH